MLPQDKGEEKWEQRYQVWWEGWNMIAMNAIAFTDAVATNRSSRSDSCIKRQDKMETDETAYYGHN